jgi:hypothetical protein
MKSLVLALLLLIFTAANAKPRIVVILGSSTAYGTGITPSDSTWVNQYGAYGIAAGWFDQVINLAVPTTDPRSALPTSMGGDSLHNIDKAISLGASVIIVSFPTNSYDWMAIDSIIYYHTVIWNKGIAADIPVYICTPQPRNPFGAATSIKLKDITTIMLSTWGAMCIDFFTPLSSGVSPYFYNPALCQSDSIHPNIAGHDSLYRRVLAANILLHPTIDAGKDSTLSTLGSALLTYSLGSMVTGAYKVIMTLNDSTGIISTDTATITVPSQQEPPPPPPPPPPPAGKIVKVNLYGGTNPYSTGGWNNWNVPNTTTGTGSGFLNYDDGTTSSIQCTISNSAGISDNGASYGGTMCPPQVLRYVSISTSTRTLTISGLNNSRKYDLEFYASRANTGNSTTFTIGGVAKTVVTDSNISNKISFADQSPVSGQIIVSITRTGTYNYVNGFQVTEK